MVGAPAPAAIAAWSTSKGRMPVEGRSPTTSTSGMRAIAASASGVTAFVKPAP
ncbi:hypothetical protein [Agrococcus sp. SL85]|uniref:hypothetical protein n=1 Tax=Agrococcus sp. SL85 TaxID=2995141 RepID=UPI002D1E3D8C|nr:hypothetical protein [Agrococcus sp. SL85]